MKSVILQKNDKATSSQKFTVFCDLEGIRDAKYITLHYVDQSLQKNKQALVVDKISVNFGGMYFEQYDHIVQITKCYFR